MATKTSIFYLILFVVHIQNSSGFALLLEAEAGTYPLGRAMPRSAASNDTTVWLVQVEHVEISFRLSSVSECDVEITNVAYTNDGPSDTITVFLDGTTVDSFHTVAHSNGGYYWNVPVNSGALGAPTELDSGSHTISVQAMATDQYGVEIDQVGLDVNCDRHCFNLSASTFASDPTCNSTHTQGSILQKSTPTACAEEDNINVPLYYDSDVHEYKVLATLPIYFQYTDLNNRSPDFTNCSLTSRVIWEIGTNDGMSDEFNTSCAHSDTGLYFVNESVASFCKTIRRDGHQQQTIAFRARGPSSGLVEASIGSIFTVAFTEVAGTLGIDVACWGREENWINLGTETFNSLTRVHSWQIPDLTWSEDSLNYIRITVTNDNTADASANFDFLRLEMRNERGETVTKIYESTDTIIEVVNIDFWWLYPQAMVIHIVNSEQEWTDVSYFRIYQKIPETTNQYAQVFVLYQDGNSRILTFPPSGYDWIPFGSSVIIGPTDPDAFRPYAAIFRVDINPNTLALTVHYTQGGKADVLLEAITGQTEVQVTNITYITNPAVPFATFRSMWVRDGNADVDHVATSIREVYLILSGWGDLTGTDFFFFRSCISQHNTLSPDIRVKINDCYVSTMNSSHTPILGPSPTQTTGIHSSSARVTTAVVSQDMYSTSNNLTPLPTPTETTDLRSIACTTTSNIVVVLCALLYSYICAMSLV